MDRLWSPWRMEYLMSEEAGCGCIFCNKLSATHDHDRENLVIHRGKHSAILMNLYPYNNGHLMVIPYEHVPTIELLSDAAMAEVAAFVKTCMAITRRVMNPHGFNIGINIGKAAGAGVQEHVHIHVVPRWEGDTNFMQVCAQTRVIPEMLPDTYDKLAAALQQLQSEK